MMEMTLEDEVEDWMLHELGLDRASSNVDPTRVANSPFFLTVALLVASVFLLGPVVISIGAVTVSVVDGVDWLLAEPRFTMLELILYQVIVGFSSAVALIAFAAGIPHVHWVEEAPGVPRRWWIHRVRRVGDRITFRHRTATYMVPTRYMARWMNRWTMVGNWYPIAVDHPEVDAIFLPASSEMTGAQIRRRWELSRERRRRSSARSAEYDDMPSESTNHGGDS